jgi:hypothetical protein
MWLVLMVPREYTTYVLLSKDLFLDISNGKLATP